MFQNGDKIVVPKELVAKPEDKFRPETIEKQSTQVREKHVEANLHKSG